MSSFALILLSLFSLSKCQTWTGQATIMDVPWNTNISETNVKIFGDIQAITKLNGNYIQNGPALWRYTPGDAHISVFMGLPMIRAFYFKNGSISFRAKMVNDTVYNMMYDMNHINNSLPYNISYVMAPTDVTVRKIGDNLLVNGPSTKSNMINETTLSVLQSPYIYDDNIGDILYPTPPHSQIDPNTKELFHMFTKTKYEKIPLYYQLYHIKAETNKRILAPNKIYIENELIEKTGFQQHMNGLTKHFYIICESPPITENLTKVIWIIVDRYSGELVAKYTSDTFTYLHYANSYEFIDEVTNEWYVICDVGITFNTFRAMKNATQIENMLNDPNNFSSIFKSLVISRFIFPLNQSETHIEYKQLLNVTGQFMPVIYYEKYNTMPYEYIYAVYSSSAYSAQDSIIKINVPLIGTKNELINYNENWNPFNLTTLNYNIWYPDSWQAFNEPYFIPNIPQIGEDDGYLLSVALNSTTNSSYLLILNATTMRKIATVHPTSQILNGALPIAFHARYYQTLYS